MFPFMFLLFCVRQRSWRLVPKQAGLLSAAEYRTRAIEFEVTVVAHMQQDRQQDEDEKVFKNTFDATFEVGGRR